MTPEGYKSVFRAIASTDGVDQFLITPKPADGEDIYRFSVIIDPYSARDDVVSALGHSGLMRDMSKRVEVGASTDPVLEWRALRSTNEGHAQIDFVDTNTEPPSEEGFFKAL